MDTQLQEFLDTIKQAQENNTFQKMLLSKARSNAEGLEKIRIRQVEIRGESMFSFVYEYPNRNTTQNFNMEQSLEQIGDLMKSVFKNAVLFTSSNDIRLSYNKKMEGRLETAQPTCSSCIPLSHNKEKKRLINPENNMYLRELGVCDANFRVIPSMQSKFKQINKFVETIDALVKESDLQSQTDIALVDMGSGKGYLTFATYDYLNTGLGMKTHVTGVEYKKDMVELCNSIARKCGFEHLNFCQGAIREYKPEKLDVLIALHACDTATDDALFQGIAANASIIVTAPCCHKQVRKAFHVTNELKAITRHGILEERQAEIATDAMRAMVLEAFGYKTQVFEFIADAHTHKNVMITGVRKGPATKASSLTQNLSRLKALFGINEFYLENLLKEYEMME